MQSSEEEEGVLLYRKEASRLLSASCSGLARIQAERPLDGLFPASIPEYLQFMASFYFWIYDFHGNGFHSTSSTPIFLIIVVRSL